ncbi:unnamed protein product [Vitrella brassicaformis CCMP3155]|uniref:Probable methylthioribulose-1-phosphate dehydratase n=2 Tax=Vitrella brassicaformis TaxID=1169539 RepID=A0A0G4EC74_VITBC|nr:unnamed protein product [Vitrella brassicaformis CCMP3155]|mmetsp:Transcript_32236/g.93235  ORF Transcript_32236/g.93235 Transcript_32236/m.93235 type:complete len:260 (+) Transcript_32236:64-843(+)|eukprot:CEL92943.1 unnamed protein product [Vitrella brassicaformis CCMP3155]
MSANGAPPPADDARERICELCRLFYDKGWASGTGGGMSIKQGDTIYMAPSGVQKERIQPGEIFELDSQGAVVTGPSHLKLSQCAPLFMAAYTLRGAGAVLHSHSLNAMLATVLDESASEFRITCLEMIKGIKGHGYHDHLVVPIIENTAHECDLADDLTAAIKAYPKAAAVLVRRHGVYVWGDSWVQAKTQAECLDYLFEAAVRMKQLGIDWTKPPLVLGSDVAVMGGKKRKLENGEAAAAGVGVGVEQQVVSDRGMGG